MGQANDAISISLAILIVVTVANHSSRRGGANGQYTGTPGAVRTRAAYLELPAALQVAVAVANRAASAASAEAFDAASKPPPSHVARSMWTTYM